jgi:D-sedoheptulose 7-phosphate isomerase
MVDRRVLLSDIPVPAVETELTARVRDLLQDSIAVKRRVMEMHTDTIVRMAWIVRRSLEAGGKLLLCGNGGSAADAQHLAAELLVRLRPQLNREPLPAVTLSLDSSSMTACANDYGFDLYFERMTRALGRPGDVLLGLTTTGQSHNVVAALRTAREMGLVTLGFLGGTGGMAATECDIALIVPSTETGRIQEAHIAVGHALMELVEDLMFPALPDYQ